MRATLCRMHRADKGRRRCTECRRWYLPTATARKTQRLCGREPCRAARRRKLARARRRRDVQDYRVEERKRQRRCREGRAEGSCHAPPSALGPLRLKAKLLESWDEATAASRATLQRRMSQILRGIEGSDGTSQASRASPSRATLPSDPSGIAGD